MLNFCDFIQDYVFSTYHHLKALVLWEVTYLRRQVTLFLQPLHKNDVTLCKLDVNVKYRTAVTGSVDFFKLE